MEAMEMADELRRADAKTKPGRAQQRPLSAL
jgi:hypothetical protein